MTRVLTIALALSLAAARFVAAQSLTTEAVATAGVSSDDASAAATQIRAFGDTPFGLRYYAEAAWARTDGTGDAFGAAYPYRNQLQVIEAYGEWFTGTRALAGIRAGRHRPPFGISSASDHAYAGFLRAPLMRYDGYYALSNNFLEHGVSLFAGTPRLMVEASIGQPADVGTAVRRDGVDYVVRGQSALGRAIVGVSHIRTRPYQSPRWAHGAAVFSGVDVRWMHGGLQLRGEWIGGQPFDGTSTTGWYADAILHRPGMGPVTAVARVERLDYDAVPSRAMHATRQTLGARVRVAEGVAAQVNVLHQAGITGQSARTALDLAITYSIRR